MKGTLMSSSFQTRFWNRILSAVHDHITRWPFRRLDVESLEDSLVQFVDQEGFDLHSIEGECSQNDFDLTFRVLPQVGGFS
jgi:hypothetical protein